MRPGHNAKAHNNSPVGVTKSTISGRSATRCSSSRLLRSPAAAAPTKATTSRRRRRVFAAVLLIAGADSPGFRWTPAIVDRLIEDGFQVIRFDHRDCGRSTRFGAESAYLLDDLAADTVGLLDHYAIDAAHVVCRSMGGMIGQLLALDHADRVLSLTMFGSSPAPGDDRLPGPMDEFVEKMTERLFAGPPQDDDGRVQWLIELDDFMAGSWDDVKIALEISAYSLKVLADATALLMTDGGSIVGLTFDATGSWPAYNWMGVAKAALETSVKYLAMDLGVNGIRVNAISAGPMRTLAGLSLIHI